MTDESYSLFQVQAAQVAAFPVTNLGDLNGALIDAKVNLFDPLASRAAAPRPSGTGGLTPQKVLCIAWVLGGYTLCR